MNQPSNLIVFKDSLQIRRSLLFQLPTLKVVFLRHLLNPCWHCFNVKTYWRSCHFIAVYFSLNFCRLNIYFLDQIVCIDFLVSLLDISSLWTLCCALTIRCHYLKFRPHYLILRRSSFFLANNLRQVKFEVIFFIVVLPLQLHT